MANNVDRYEPQTAVTRLPDLVDRLFRESFVLPSGMDRALAARTALPVNLYEISDGYVMQVALPGMKSEQLDIQVVGREVMLKGTCELSTPEKGRPVWQGIPGGEFQETLTLPVDLNGDAATASYESGILTVTLPKAEHLRPKSISVEVKK